jgi:hypothetical protein
MKKIIGFVLFASILASSCATGYSRYYWGNYSESLYKYKKSPSTLTLTAHKADLVKIISKSKSHGKKVPPGLYCELAYIYAKEGNAEESLKYFNMEIQAFPESKTFVERLKRQVNPGDIKNE